MISILIVTYNCKVQHSKTISGFLNSTFPFKDINLVIWNNGPRIYDCFDFSLFEKKGINVFLHQTIENKPLSHVYNEFIYKYPSDYYVVLDHDSDVTEQYINDIMNFESAKALVGVPSVTVGGRYISPSIGGVYSNGPYSNKQRLFAIGSGVIFSYKIVELFLEKFGNVFDDAFALYGVDASFFIRLHQLKRVESIKMISGFSHSLSRMELESPEVKVFRNKERSYDIGIQLRRYPSTYQYWFTIKVFIKILLNRLGYNVKDILLSYISGKHPRC